MVEISSSGSGEGPGRKAGATRQTTTDAHGQFAFAHSYPGSVVVAQKGAARSIRSHDPLVIQPTITVQGSVVGPRPAGQLLVEARVPGDAYRIIVPIHANSTYTLGGVTKDFTARVAVLQDTRTNETASRSVGAALALAVPAMNRVN